MSPLQFENCRIAISFRAQRPRLINLAISRMKLDQKDSTERRRNKKGRKKWKSFENGEKNGEGKVQGEEKMAKLIALPSATRIEIDCNRLA